MCPYCKNDSFKVVKRGFFYRKSTKTHKVQRYFCKTCLKHFCDRTNTHDYRENKAYLKQAVYRMLCSGVSQRRMAFILGVDKKTIARKILRLGKAAAEEHQACLKAQEKMQFVVFDEMETFEHTKLKPLSIVVAVEEQSRKLIAAEVAQMPAKGRLAKKSVKKYGKRKDLRPQAIRRVLARVKDHSMRSFVIKSDLSPRYPKYIKEVIPKAQHEPSLGRAPCVVGQGELKAGGFDPLFSLNHTCAMIRDNVKRLSRKTWCTTKLPEVLQAILNIYICFHNKLVKRLPRYFRMSGARFMHS